MLYLLELLIALAPTYVIRFGFGALRLDLLELLVVAFWIAGLATLIPKASRVSRMTKWKESLESVHASIYVTGILFLLAGFISAAISPTRDRALGELFAYFIQPAITFLYAVPLLRDAKAKEHFTKFLLWYVAAISAYAAIQYVTLVGLPMSWWGNANEPKRALSVFAYPNAFALFIAPLLAYAMPFVFRREPIIHRTVYVIAFCIGVVGLGLSLSRGGWLGLLAAVIVFLFVAASRNTRIGFSLAAAVVAIVIVCTPILRFRVTLPFMGEKSTVSRYSLWDTGEKMIVSSPVFGKGLNGFASNFNMYNTDPNLAPLDYPHNLFLNFYVETGLLGLLSFLALSVTLAYHGWVSYREGDTYGLAIILFLIALYVHGMVDVPYFKNDLSLLFWVVIASIPYISHSPKKTPSALSDR